MRKIHIQWPKSCISSWDAGLLLIGRGKNESSRKSLSKGPILFLLLPGALRLHQGIDFEVRPDETLLGHLFCKIPVSCLTHQMTPQGPLVSLYKKAIIVRMAIQTPVNIECISLRHLDPLSSLGYRCRTIVVDVGILRQEKNSFQLSAFSFQPFWLILDH